MNEQSSHNFELQAMGPRFDAGANLAPAVDAAPQSNNEAEKKIQKLTELTGDINAFENRIARMAQILLQQGQITQEEASKFDYDYLDHAWKNTLDNLLRRISSGQLSDLGRIRPNIAIFAERVLLYPDEHQTNFETANDGIITTDEDRALKVGYLLYDLIVDFDTYPENLTEVQPLIPEKKEGGAKKVLKKLGDWSEWVRKKGQKKSASAVVVETVDGESIAPNASRITFEDPSDVDNFGLIETGEQNPNLQLQTENTNVDNTQNPVQANEVENNSNAQTAISYVEANQAELEAAAQIPVLSDSWDRVEVARELYEAAKSAEVDVDDRKLNYVSATLQFLELSAQLGVELPQGKDYKDFNINVAPLYSEVQQREREQNAALITEILATGDDRIKQILGLRKDHTLTYEVAWSAVELINRIKRLNTNIYPKAKIEMYRHAKDLQLELVRIRARIDVLQNHPLIELVDRIHADDTSHVLLTKAVKSLNEMRNRGEDLHEATQAIHPDHIDRLIELIEPETESKWQRFIQNMINTKQTYAGMGTAVAMNLAIMSLKAAGYEVDQAFLSNSIQMVSAAGTAALAGGVNAYLRGRITQYEGEEGFWHRQFRAADSVGGAFSEKFNGLFGLKNIQRFMMGYAFGNMAFGTVMAGIAAYNHEYNAGNTQLESTPTSTATPAAEQGLNSPAVVQIGTEKYSYADLPNGMGDINGDGVPNNHDILQDSQGHLFYVENSDNSTFIDQNDLVALPTSLDDYGKAEITVEPKTTGENMVLTLHGQDADRTRLADLQIEVSPNGEVVSQKVLLPGSNLATETYSESPVISKSQVDLIAANVDKIEDGTLNVVVAGKDGASYLSVEIPTSENTTSPTETATTTVTAANTVEATRTPLPTNTATSTAVPPTATPTVSTTETAVPTQTPVVEPTPTVTATSKFDDMTEQGHFGGVAQPDGRVVQPRNSDYTIVPGHHGEFAGSVVNSDYTIVPNHHNESSGASLESVHHRTTSSEVMVNGQMMQVPENLKQFDGNFKVIPDPNNSDAVYLVAHSEVDSDSVQAGDYAVHIVREKDSDGETHLVIDTQGFVVGAPVTDHASEVRAIHAQGGYQHHIASGLNLKPINEVLPGVEPITLEEIYEAGPGGIALGTPNSITGALPDSVPETVQETIGSTADEVSEKIDSLNDDQKKIVQDFTNNIREQVGDVVDAIRNRGQENHIPTENDTIESSSSLETSVPATTEAPVLLQTHEFAGTDIWTESLSQVNEAIENSDILQVKDGVVVLNGEVTAVTPQELTDSMKDWLKAANADIANAQGRDYDPITAGDTVVHADTFKTYDEMIDYMRLHPDVKGVDLSPEQAVSMIEYLTEAYSTDTPDNMQQIYREHYIALPRVGGSGDDSAWTTTDIQRDGKAAQEFLFRKSIGDPVKVYDIPVSKIDDTKAAEAVINGTDQNTGPDDEQTTATSVTDQLEILKTQSDSSVDSIYDQLQDAYPGIIHTSTAGDAAKSMIHHYAEHVMTEPYEKALEILTQEHELKLAVLGQQAYDQYSDGLAAAMASTENPITNAEVPNLSVSDERLGLSPGLQVLMQAVKGIEAPITVEIGGQERVLSVEEQHTILANTLGNPAITELLTPVNGQISEANMRGAIAQVNMDNLLYAGNVALYRQENLPQAN